MLLPVVIGAAAVAFIIHKRRRWRRWHGHRHHHHHHRRWRGGPWYVMSVLDTSPAQEKVIREELGQLRERGRVAKDEAFAARADLAEALRADTFDRGRFDAAASRVRAAFGGLETAFADALARVHDTLDARQRARLADLLAEGRGPGFGPFR